MKIEISYKILYGWLQVSLLRVLLIFYSYKGLTNNIRQWVLAQVVSPLFKLQKILSYLVNIEKKYICVSLTSGKKKKRNPTIFYKASAL